MYEEALKYDPDSEQIKEAIKECQFGNVAYLSTGVLFSLVYTKFVNQVAFKLFCVYRLFK